jgi:hypothetical protein
MLDPGPCHTCPLATGILFTPTGLHHTCKPEDWRLCNLLYRTSKGATQAEMRHRSLRRGWAAVRKTLTLVQLFRRSSAR